ncbi:pyrroline-5-carboxylate reductase [Thermotoga profunda]|uniref:pyrroline-5-carboxylate reductase n=1 Tax=Thermotoga profunda TaxID=1508420 RepID=UPI000596FED1|nr:pyrroline-5-carboxylate reductase [Thermotoga profunda]
MIGIVGVGNIGSIIAKRLVESGLYKADEIFLANRSQQKLIPFVEKGYRLATPAEISRFCDVIFLCVKPQDSEEMFSQLGKLNALIVSTMTAVTIERIILKTNCEKVVRIMPNVPAMIGRGVVGVSRSSHVGEDDWKRCCKLLSALGTIVEVDEKHLAAVTALSGSAPAFIFVIIEALIDAGIRVGLSYETSRLMVLETLRGSSELLLRLGDHPGEFRHVVTSPAGTTIEGIYRMEREGIRGALMKTIQETYLKAIQLQKELSQ